MIINRGLLNITQVGTCLFHQYDLYEVQDACGELMYKLSVTYVPVIWILNAKVRGANCKTAYDFLFMMVMIYLIPYGCLKCFGDVLTAYNSGRPSFTKEMKGHR